MQRIYRKMTTRIGDIHLVATQSALVGIFWHPPRQTNHESLVDADSEILDRAQQQIREYLAGQRLRFDLPLAPEGTEFQKQVWKVLEQIPYGETRSYLDIAKAVNKPLACRAVGTANGRNPLSLVIPCHRVIRRGGAIGGYAGGLATKEELLRLEHAVVSLHESDSSVEDELAPSLGGITHHIAFPA